MNKNDILFHLFFLYQTQIEYGFDTLRVISNFLRRSFRNISQRLTDIHPLYIEQIKSRRPGLDINAVQRTKIPRRPLKRSFASFALNSLATRVCAPIMRPNDNVATRVTRHDRSTLLFTLPLPSAKSRFTQGFPSFGQRDVYDSI